MQHSVAYMHDEPELSLKEWALDAKISRESNNPRRFSASYVRSSRKESRSFRSDINIPSTSSSPGYPYYKDEIDPATYSFSAALKELQARSNYSSLDCKLKEGFALNSKWREAERYICNPLSGEVPLECLSAKSLERTSYSNLMNRITMSSPVSYSSHMQNITTKHCTTSKHEISDLHIQSTIHLQVKKMVGLTKYVGIQSTLDCPTGSSNPSTSPVKGTLSMQMKSENRELPEKLVTWIMPEREVQGKETGDKDDKKVDKKGEQSHIYRQSGCFSWVMKRQQREKHHTKKKNIMFLPHIIGC